MFELTNYLNERRRLIDQALDQHMPPDTTHPARLHEAMRYCVFSNGKRLRPILCLAAAEACQGTVDAALLPALAVEVLHTYTLVHDDLPAMDDDDLRRGQPTAHIQYGEANAILAGDALLTLAFEWLAQCVPPAPYLPGQYALELAQAGGSQGVIGGQYEDLAAHPETATPEQLDYIHLHKTACLIRAAMRIGAISAHASSPLLDALTLYGCHIGLAFQITDDLLDETGITEQLGKPAGSDRKNQKLTYITLHGIDEARKRAEKLVAEAVAALAPLPGDTRPLIAIAQYILERKH